MDKLTDEEVAANKACVGNSMFTIQSGFDLDRLDGETILSILFRKPCWIRMTDQQRRIISNIWQHLRYTGKEASQLRISSLNRTGSLSHGSGLAVDISGPPGMLLWLYKQMDNAGFDGQILIGSKAFPELVRKGRKPADRHLHLSYLPDRIPRGIEIDKGLPSNVKRMTPARMRRIEGEYGHWGPGQSPSMIESIFGPLGDAAKYTVAILGLWLLIEILDKVPDS